MTGIEVLNYFTEYTAFPNYKPDGPEITVGLIDDIYRKNDNEDSIEFRNT